MTTTTINDDNLDDETTIIVMTIMIIMPTMLTAMADVYPVDFALGNAGEAILSPPEISPTGNAFRFTCDVNYLGQDPDLVSLLFQPVRAGLRFGGGRGEGDKPLLFCDCSY